MPKPHTPLRLLLCLLGLAGCIGMRTPLDDAAAPKSRRDAADALPIVCGSTMTIDTRPVDADILIVLDRSESMLWSLTADANCRAGANDCSTRAEAVVDAVDAVVRDNPDIRWGLQLFPSASFGTCGIGGAPDVPISSSSAAAIATRLAGFTTSLSTPTAASLNAAIAYLRSLADRNNKAILLATDGLPNCGSGADWTKDDMAGAVRMAAAAKQAGFPVYVVGIGPSVDNLDSLAVAGGTGSYYPATSTAALNAALGAIAKVVTTTCTVTANAIPVDKDLVEVTIDQALVPQDDGAGWTFDPRDPTYATIVLHGSYCDRVLGGATAQLQVTFGCPDGGVD